MFSTCCSCNGHVLVFRAKKETGDDLVDKEQPLSEFTFQLSTFELDHQSKNLKKKKLWLKLSHTKDIDLLNIGTDVPSVSNKLYSLRHVFSKAVICSRTYMLTPIFVLLFETKVGLPEHTEHVSGLCLVFQYHVETLWSIIGHFSFLLNLNEYKTISDRYKTRITVNIQDEPRVSVFYKTQKIHTWRYSNNKTNTELFRNCNNGCGDGCKWSLKDGNMLLSYNENANMHSSFTLPTKAISVRTMEVVSGNELAVVQLEDGSLHVYGQTLIRVFQSTSTLMHCCLVDDFVGDGYQQLLIVNKIGKLNEEQRGLCFTFTGLLFDGMSLLKVSVQNANQVEPLVCPGTKRKFHEEEPVTSRSKSMQKRNNLDSTILSIKPSKKKKKKKKKSRSKNFRAGTKSKEDLIVSVIKSLQSRLDVGSAYLCKLKDELQQKLKLVHYLTHILCAPASLPNHTHSTSGSARKKCTSTFLTGWRHRLVSVDTGNGTLTDSSQTCACPTESLKNHGFQVRFAPDQKILYLEAALENVTTKVLKSIHLIVSGIGIALEVYTDHVSFVHSKNKCTVMAKMYLLDLTATRSLNCFSSENRLDVFAKWTTNDEKFRTQCLGCLLVDFVKGDVQIAYSYNSQQERTDRNILIPKITKNLNLSAYHYKCQLKIKSCFSNLSRVLSSNMQFSDEVQVVFRCEPRHILITLKSPEFFLLSHSMQMLSSALPDDITVELQTTNRKWLELLIGVVEALKLEVALENTRQIDIEDNRSWWRERLHLSIQTDILMGKAIEPIVYF